MAKKSKNVNPYRKGSAYHAICEDIIEASKGGALAKGITRKELLDNGHSPADVTVVLSPRAFSKRGDVRGNISARGHLYFMHLPARKVIEIEDENFEVVSSKFDPEDPQRFIFRMRDKELPPLTRKSKVKISDVGAYFASLVVNVSQKVSSVLKKGQSEETEETSAEVENA